MTSNYSSTTATNTTVLTPLQTTIAVNTTVLTPSQTTTAMAASEGENTILYVWVPYAFFLLAILIVLVASFVRHRKRLLRRRRVTLDYIEANVLAKRPRILRMFSPSVDYGGVYPDLEQFTSSEDVQAPSGSKTQPEFAVCNEENARKFGRFSSGSSFMGGSQMSTGFLPILEMPPRGVYCSVDDPDGMWYPDRFYGHHNMGFSFDEDFGRCHTKYLPPPHRFSYSLPRGTRGRGGMHHHASFPQQHPSTTSSREDVVFETLRTKHGFVTHSDTIEHVPQLSRMAGVHGPNPGATHPPQPAAFHAQIHESDSPTQHSFNGEQDDNAYRTPVWTSRSLHAEPCTHCGSVPETSSHSHTKPAAPRPKKRHAYKRQSAYSDSFELRATTPDILILDADSSEPSATATSDSSGRHGNRDRPSPAGKRRAESESTDLTTLTSSSRSTSRSRSKSGAGADEMLKGLEVYTIEAHNDLPRPEAAPRQTSFPDSGFNAASSTTDAALRRTASACLPYQSELQHHTDSTYAANPWHSLSPLRHSVPLTMLSADFPSNNMTPSSDAATTSASTTTTTKKPSQSSASPNITSPSASATTTSTLSSVRKSTNEKSIFWLSGSADIQQTLV